MLEPVSLGKILYEEDEELFKKVSNILTRKELDIEWTYCFPSKKRELVPCIAHIMQRMVDNSNMGKNLGIDENLAIEFKRLLASLNYLCNSNSFKTGKYQSFDKEEINRKLGRR